MFAHLPSGVILIRVPDGVKVTERSAEVSKKTIALFTELLREKAWVMRMTHAVYCQPRSSQTQTSDAWCDRCATFLHLGPFPRLMACTLCPTTVLAIQSSLRSWLMVEYPAPHAFDAFRFARLRTDAGKDEGARARSTRSRR
ncbi:hypothetical protein GGX14DRAFT_570080 [Mycena pura]|uniref:Uncharacterized protein n=1 Tax=Mycena pura TaxID=153505 RepID=A0AAD6YDA2_9AGAR|nr:hypothetical protein GGX14DRAFT_570080 [Mycena pura]